jgi:hypothetical protein
VLNTHGAPSYTMSASFLRNKYKIIKNIKPHVVKAEALDKYNNSTYQHCHYHGQL